MPFNFDSISSLAIPGAITAATAAVSGAFLVGFKWWLERERDPVQQLITRRLAFYEAWLKAQMLLRLPDAELNDRIEIARQEFDRCEREFRAQERSKKDWKSWGYKFFKNLTLAVLLFYISMTVYFVGTSVRALWNGEPWQAALLRLLLAGWCLVSAIFFRQEYQSARTAEAKNRTKLADH